MLTLTENAASAIRTLTLQTDQPDESGVRIAPTTGEGGTQALGLTVTADPQPGDQVLEAEGARVFLDSDVAPSLEDKASMRRSTRKVKCSSGSRTKRPEEINVRRLGRTAGRVRQRPAAGQVCGVVSD
jgi:Fe-S cluster assembly iron-binding protein IscA